MSSRSSRVEELREKLRQRQIEASTGDTGDTGDVGDTAGVKDNGFSSVAKQLGDEREILHNLRRERSRMLKARSAEDTSRMMQYLGIEDSPFEDFYDDGSQGSPEPQSVQGPQGSQGSQGPQGPQGPANDDFLSEMQNVSDLIAPVGREEVDITGNILFTTSKLLYISRLPVDPEIARIAKEIAFAIQTGDREYLAYITAVLQAMVSKEGLGRLEAIRQSQVFMGAPNEEEEVERKRSLLEKIRGR